MTPRSVLRYETWTLQPDREPDAELVLYAMQCVVDGETSPTSEDFAEPQNWVLGTLRAEPVPPHLPGDHHPALEDLAADVTRPPDPRTAPR
ncbi:hypothetical protein ACRAR1_12020 [Streptomyces sanyensis]|uniref:DUF7848 domain-containing protein n=1 Tax=Streptomyces sanyensis TaxID=568869 RepID=UPI003D76F318